jgi:hypothetical protein
MCRPYIDIYIGSTHRIISQRVNVLNIDLRICSNSNFTWPQYVHVISKISKFGGGEGGLQHLNPKLYELLDVARIYS